MKTTRKQNLRAAAALLLGALSIAPALAQEAKSKPAPAQTLITNARIFDGKSDPIPDGMNVLIEGNKIARISRTALTPATGATVIDAKGRMLVDGDPIANLKLIEDPAKNFVIIMKDGKIYKNTLKQP